MTTKKCTKCSVAKPLKDFYTDSRRKDGATSWCRDCWREYDALRREKLGPRGRKARKLKYMYGMSYTDYATMLKEQNNVCAICSGKETVINNKSAKLQKLCVDHDHVTGKVRALLCTACNKGLGQFNDDPARVLAAYNYILKHTLEEHDDGSATDGDPATQPGESLPGDTGPSREPKSDK